MTLSDITNITITNIILEDYPDFVDAYVERADWPNGEPVADSILEVVNESCADEIHQHIHETQLYLP